MTGTMLLWVTITKLSSINSTYKCKERDTQVRGTIAPRTYGKRIVRNNTNALQKQARHVLASAI